jgi:predicted acylesterase/phospholipase RssA
LEKGYRVLALAGTSAGAIVATLAWAGFSPSDMREVFVRLAGGREEPQEENVLAGLMGPFEPNDFNVGALKTLKSSVTEMLESLKSMGSNESYWWEDVGTAWKARKFIKSIGPHVLKRGFFCGQELEFRVERWIRAATPALKELVPETEPIRFRHVTDLILKNQLYKPPLLLTATNLSTKRLEVISSIDQRYAEVPIAKAVRASVGFPVFFTPQEIPQCPGGGWFVDGGLVSNFPIWTLSDALRSAMQSSHLEEKYRTIIHRPWIRIGLRVVDDPEAIPDLSRPTLFFGALWEMLSGGTRNELEDLLAAGAARSVVIRQGKSTTDGPKDFLDVTSLSPALIDSMFGKGQAFAAERLEEVISSESVRSEEQVAAALGTQLEDLVKKCEVVFGANENCKFRANIFLPVWVGYEPRMRLVYSYNMAGDPDTHMEFPDLESGLTGFCYLHRHPQVCNLQKIGQLRTSEPERFDAMFGMDRRLQMSVRPDRSWLASVPIFDPLELRIGRKDEPQRKQRHKGMFYLNVETDFEGPVLGVLNVDAGWDYSSVGLDENPDRFVFDTRIQAILAIMQTASFRMAGTLSGDMSEM